MIEHVGSYAVESPIGQGGMGTVYRGRDPRFDRLVAIKVLHSQFQRDPGVVERFKAEAVIQAKLSHPHIVTVLDFVAGSDTLAIVMEYVDGQPLGTPIEREAGPLPVERTVRLMDQVLSAMGYAHKRGLVHRDIKPSNILVQSIEGQEYAKVMDFGIAKILGSEKVRTATGAKMGTLAYMSPEHVRSPREVDTRSDVYSLGVVLYEMLTGQVPFDADSEYELMRRIVEEEPRDVLSLSGSLPGGLSAVVETALAKDPANRFPSCDAMRQALVAAPPAAAPPPAPAARSVLLASPSDATPPGAEPLFLRSAEPAPAVAAPPSRPGWLGPALAAVGVVAVAGLVAVVMQQRAAESERRLRAEAEAQLQRQREEAQVDRQRLELEKDRALPVEREKARTTVARFESIEVLKGARAGKEGAGEYRVEFPEVRGLANASALQRINAALGGLAVPDTSSSQYSAGFEVRRLTREVLSLTSTAMTYTEGAAHPNYAMMGFTFDLSTGQALGLGDILGRPPAALVDLVKENAARAAGECGTDVDGLKDLRGDQFYLKDDALVVFFQPYEIAPYACGVVEVPLTREALAPRLGAESPLLRLLTSTTAPTTLSEADARAFVDRYLSVVSGSDADRVAGLYAEGVDYYSWGATPRSKVGDDKRLFFRRWPEHRYQREGDLRITEPAPGRTEVVFRVRFEVRGPGRANDGLVEKTLGLERQGGELLIVSERETVIDRSAHGGD